jgi:nitrogen fixation/metabolism regulation signal transduction histidine kinase
VHLDAGETDWREQIVLRGEVGRRVLTCACTALPGEGDQAGGYVVVFDDITGLLQAQRDAAWGEVARRLAHEIKNPLTPIQLSAERLRRKYLDKMTGEEAQILDRATHTIVQQVEAMKEMVNAFSDYARSRSCRPLPLPGGSREDCRYVGPDDAFARSRRGAGAPDSAQSVT